MLEQLAGLADLAEEYQPFTPMNLWEEFKEGQARDEARQVRASDIEREEKWLERNSISNRIREGMSQGLSLTAAAGIQPGSHQTSVIGQDSGYLAMNRSGTSSNSRTERLTQQLLQSQIDHQDLQNLKLFQELEHDRSTGIGNKPAVDSFMPGGSQAIKGGRVVDKPMERTTSYPGESHMEPGAINSLGYSKTETGLMPVPSKDVKERLEDSPYEWSHFYRYGVTPGFGSKSGKPPIAEITKAFPGAVDAAWDPVMLEWAPVYPRKGGRFPLGPLPRWFYDNHKKFKERNKTSNEYPEGHLFHRNTKKRRSW